MDESTERALKQFISEALSVRREHRKLVFRTAKKRLEAVAAMFGALAEIEDELDIALAKKPV